MEANGEHKRGRPKKVAPTLVTEGGEKLAMQHEETTRVQIPQVVEEMRSVYAQFFRENYGDTVPHWLDKLNTMQLNNPFLQNRRLKSISDIPGVMSGEKLAEALGAPQDSEQPLRKQGWALSSSQYLYYKILRMSADVPLYKWYKTPEFLSAGEYKSQRFIREDKFVDEWLKTFDLPNTLKRVSLDVKREGKSVYVLRNSVNKTASGEKHVNYCTWQKLPTDFVKLTGIGEHGFTASFNMLLFLNPAFNIKQYPDFMQDLWYQMVDSGAITDNMLGSNFFDPRGYSVKGTQKDKNTTKDERYTVHPEKLAEFHYSYNAHGSNFDGCGILEATKRSYLFWVQLPQELCYVFASDTSNAWACPDTSGLFAELQNLTDFDTLSGLVASTPLTAMLTAEVPMIAESNLNAGADQTALHPDTITGYQNKFNASVSGNIDAYIAPFKNMKLQSLPNVPNSSDISTKATQNFITKAGMSGLITSTEKPSVSQVKAAQMLFEAECDFLTRQYESVLNMIINDLLGNEYRWRIHIWGGIYSFENEVKRDKEMFVSGVSFVLPKLASAYDITVRELKGIDEYIHSLDIYDDFKTVTQATQERIAEEGGGTGEVGRPKIDESDIESDATAASIDAGNDTKDTRDFSASEKSLILEKAKERLSEGQCILCGKQSDASICDECSMTLELDVVPEGW